jgi:hypothetical protein
VAVSPAPIILAFTPWHVNLLIACANLPARTILSCLLTTANDHLLSRRRAARRPHAEDPNDDLSCNPGGGGNIGAIIGGAVGGVLLIAYIVFSMLNKGSSGIKDSASTSVSSPSSTSAVTAHPMATASAVVMPVATASAVAMPVATASAVAMPMATAEPMA